MNKEELRRALAEADVALNKTRSRYFDAGDAYRKAIKRRKEAYKAWQEAGKEMKDEY